MDRLYKSQDLFEAEIKILTEKEGGRKTPAHNGIRWDFVYKENNEEKNFHRIHPDFIDENGDSLDSGLFLEGTLKARMHTLVEDRIPFHKERISVGTEFYCVEGPKPVAYGVVTKITGLEKST